MMYGERASWWPLLSPPAGYEEEAAPTTEHGGDDGGARGLRFLEWTWHSDPADTTCLVDYAFMMRAADGTVRIEHDRHVEGLFSRAEWLRLFSHVGFQARVVPFEHSELEPGSHEVFVATRPADGHRPAA